MRTLIEIQVPIYKKEKYVLTDLGLRDSENYQYLLTLIDDSVEQDLQLSDLKLPSVEKRIIKNGRNLGSFNSRVRGLAKSRGDIVVPLDDDDMLIQDGIEKCADLLINNDDVGIIFPKHYWCKEEYCTKDDFTQHKIYNLIQCPLIKCVGPVHTVIRGDWIRECMVDFLLSGLIQKLYEMTGTERVCLLEDYYAMSWMRPWMYNNHIGKMDVWIPIHYYYDFARTNDYDGTKNSVVDYDDPKLQQYRDKWYNEIMREYWKW